MEMPVVISVPATKPRGRKRKEIPDNNAMKENMVPKSQNLQISPAEPDPGTVPGKKGPRAYKSMFDTPEGQKAPAKSGDSGKRPLAERPGPKRPPARRKTTGTATSEPPVVPPQPLPNLTEPAPKFLVHEDAEPVKKKGKGPGGERGYCPPTRLSHPTPGRRKSLVKKKRVRHSVATVPDAVLPAPGLAVSGTERKSPPSQTPSPSGEKKIQADKDVAVLESMFPNIDPAFLRAQYTRMKKSLEDTVNLLSVNKSASEAPTKKRLLQKVDAEKLRKKYTTEFSVNDFVAAIPDPWNYFLNTESHNSIRYADHSLFYLKNKFTKHYVQTIQSTLAKCEYSLYRAHKELSDKRKTKMFKLRTTERLKTDSGAREPSNVDFQFLQEVAFIEHEREIIERLKEVETEKFKKMKSTLKTGSLLRCNLCCTTNLAWESVAGCRRQHVICKDCINNHAHAQMRIGNFDIRCPLNCNDVLPRELLQDILSPDLVTILVRKNQFDELKAAGVSDLVHCPRCFYIKVESSSTDSIFYCMNPACLRESCLKCKRVNHEPLSCIEAEEQKSGYGDEDDDANLEEGVTPKNTSNILSICCHCHNEFIKEEDSKLMVCPCGNVICWYCRLPYPDCPHFNGHDPNNNINDHEHLHGRDNVDDDEDDDDDDDDDENYDSVQNNDSMVGAAVGRGLNPVEPSEAPDFARSDSVAF